MNAIDFAYAVPLLASLVGALLSIIPVLYLEEIVSVVASVASVLGAVLMFTLPDTSHGIFYVDGLTKVMTLTISLVYTSAVIYSITYLKHLDNPLFQKRLYYFLLNSFVLTMLFSVVANNLGLIWVGIEATTVTSALLVATENNETTIESAWRYVIIVSSGLVISLLSIVLLYAAGKDLQLASYLFERGSGGLFTAAVLLAIVGYGTKAGVIPLSSWLPDVHGRAPSPVSALFSGVLLPVAMYGIVRVVQPTSLPEVHLVLLIFGLLTVAVAAILAARQNDYKRMFAYSTAEKMGMILVGLSTGPIGALGAVLLLVSHAFAKAAAFFLTGNLLARYRTTHIHDIHGVAARMPKTGYSLFFASLAVTGAPPFGVFLGELLILAGVVRNYGIVLAAFVSLFLLIAFIGINLRIVAMVFSPSGSDPMERGRVGTFVPILNIMLALAAIGLAPLLPHLLKGVLGI